MNTYIIFSLCSAHCLTLPFMLPLLRLTYSNRLHKSSIKRFHFQIFGKENSMLMEYIVWHCSGGRYFRQKQPRKSGRRLNNSKTKGSSKDTRASKDTSFSINSAVPNMKAVSGGDADSCDINCVSNLPCICLVSEWLKIDKKFRFMFHWLNA